MKLRRVDIFGFKSFRDRTALDISDGVTAVVGPNGCGKSNIVDAIRWALGSQSPRELRGRAMEDVIFGGSESHRPSGYAEVSLVLSNEDGSATGPWRDVAEIRVTRRLYRSGESEYEINRSRTRLRDIQELFLGTGVSLQDGYSIIEQGRVGFIVSSRPEERRTLIEEAAGVTRYRFQRKHTERRLQQTRDNLVRVRDIMEEVSRQVKALEGQAERARRWSLLREAKRGHELRLALLRHHEAACALEEAGAASKAAGDGELVARTAVSRASADLESVRVEAHLAEKALAEHAELAYRLRTRFDVLENDAGHQRRELQALDARSTSLEGEIGRLHEEESARRVSIARLHEKCEGATAQVELAERERTRAAGELERARNTEAEAREAFEELETRARAAAREQAALEGALEADDAELARLQERGLVADAEVEPAQRALAEAEAALTTLQENATGAESALSSASERSAELQAFEERARAALHEAEANARRLEGQVRTLGSRREALEQTVARGEGLERGVTQTLAAAREGRLKGVQGTLAERLRPEPEREVALGVTLGPWAEAVLVETRDDARALLAWAREERIAVCVLVLEGPCVEARIPGWCTLAAPVPELVATRLVEAREVEDVLRDSGEDIAWDASLCWRHAPEAWERRDVSAGRGQALFRSARQLDEVRREESERQRALDASLLERAQREQEHEEAVRAREAAEAALSELRRRAVDERTRTREAAQEVGRLRKVHDRARADAESAAARREELEERAATRRRRLAEVVDARARDAAELEAVRTTYALARRELDAAREVREHARVAEVRAAEALRGARAEMQMAERERSRAGERLEEAGRELAAVSERSATLRAQLAGGEETMAQARREVHAAEERRSELEAANALATSALREREAELVKRQRALDEARQAAQQAALTLEKARAEVTWALQSLQERFELTHREALAVEALPADREAEEAALQKVLRAIERIGPVNPAAESEYEEALERLTLLQTQQDDLKDAMADLEKAIRKMDRTSRDLFRDTFEAVNLGFQAIFPRLFRGGRARLELSEPDNLLESGVEIVAQPPGKRLQSITLLSGGEKALTAVALIFAIFQLKPAPFSILDEVDAPLDEGNVGRFADLVAELADRSQFLLITHNRRTMEAAGTLYGITMEEPGVSKVVGVRMEREGNEREGYEGARAQEKNTE